MKRYIDEITLENPELVPVIVNALEKDGMYEVELRDNLTPDFDLERNRKSDFKYKAYLRVWKVEKIEAQS